MNLTFTLDKIKDAVTQVFEHGKDIKVWAIHGEMGAGKTTFIHALCEYMGVTSSIGSPTYSIINEYRSERYGTIFHMDLYRLKDEEEALQAGVEDALFSGNLCFVEWPERAGGLLPEKCLHVTLQVVDEQTRLISLV